MEGKAEIEHVVVRAMEAGVMLPWPVAAASIVSLFAYAFVGQTAGNGI
jgi:hypothetical protein